MTQAETAYLFWASSDISTANRRGFGLLWPFTNHGNGVCSGYLPRELIDASLGKNVVITSFVARRVCNAAGSVLLSYLLHNSNPISINPINMVTSAAAGVTVDRVDGIMHPVNISDFGTGTQFYYGDASGTNPADDAYIHVSGYIENTPQTGVEPTRVAQDGWYSLKRRT